MNELLLNFSIAQNSIQRRKLLLIAAQYGNKAIQHMSILCNYTCCHNNLAKTMAICLSNGLDPDIGRKEGHPGPW